MTAAAVAGVVIANLAMLCWFPLSFRHGAPSPYVYRADMDVYRLGADAWLRGADLYGVLPRLRIGTIMPFTYPPIAAALFTPLAAMSFTAASLVLAATTIVLVAVVVAVTLRALAVRVSWLLVGALLPVALDCLVRRPRWPRGLLVGVAAAVKLTPAVFVLYFLVRGDRKAAAVSWCHHWVWCVPVLLATGVHAWRTRTAVTLAAGGLLLFVLSPHWWWPPGHEWTLWRLTTGNLYVCFAILTLLVVTPAAARGRRSRVASSTMTSVIKHPAG